MSHRRIPTGQLRFEHLEDRWMLTTFVDPGRRLEADFLADVDGDGDLDGVSASQWWSNDGTGRFTRQGVFTESVGRLQDMGDVDGDGKLDALFAVGRDGGTEFQVRQNEGQWQLAERAQTIGPVSRLGEFSRGGAVFGDFDGDSLLDILEVEAQQTASDEGQASYRIWFNDGQGGFTRSGDAFGVLTPA